ncbi:carbohydrate binding domain-containing protein [Okeanomitos corallinicola TIOX110]|uniref:Carbohydrate binding domain-containing protein n=1 Tax=Okeanomitos corallinicola TIOX110 TaxID=3133117 RepID=A0ABZ2UXC5_9CYAN
MKLSRILPLVVGGAVAGMVVSAASPAQALEFVTNGDFENGLTGWTNNGGWSPNNTNISGNSSNRAYADALSSSPASLSQVISGLVVGQTYNFSFDYYQLFSGLPNNISATLGSTTLASLTNNNTPAFTTFSTSFVASQPSDVLTFTAYDDGLLGGTYLDNVSLTGATAVPFDVPGGATIPTVGSLFALGLMRQAKKRLAVKKVVVDSGDTVV